MERIVQDATQARDALFPDVRRHADLLTTQFDMIEERHRGPAETLAAWVAENYRPDQPVGIVVICTGNSRRSMLGAVMGNVAATYHGLPDVRFFSGGTAPSAFNARTVAALKDVGVEVEPAGEEAPRGSAGEANPVYQVRWGTGLEAAEFSKLYSDAQNPQTGFAAILVCGEADDACPTVRGAAVRIPVPYTDPKAFDGSAFEAAKYAERRDDIGRFMLSVLMQAHRLVTAQK